MPILPVLLFHCASRSCNLTVALLHKHRILWNAQKRYSRDLCTCKTESSAYSWRSPITKGLRWRLALIVDSLGHSGARWTSLNQPWFEDIKSCYPHLHANDTVTLATTCLWPILSCKAPPKCSHLLCIMVITVTISDYSSGALISIVMEKL